jgi:hypothetical protein
MNYTPSRNNANCLFPQEEYTKPPKLQGGPYTENLRSLPNQYKKEGIILILGAQIFESLFPLLKRTFSSKSSNFLHWQNIFLGLLEWLK